MIDLFFKVIVSVNYVGASV